MPPTWDLEKQLLAEYPGAMVVGMDEVGVASYAGPLVAGAVCLPRSAYPWYGELNDSKQVAKERRSRLAELIKQHTWWGVGETTPGEIDELGVMGARVLAMRRALVVCSRKLGVREVVVVVDDSRLVRAHFTEHGLYVDKGDERSVSVAAASILAKVSRDTYMAGLGQLHGVYGFETNVGYGTPRHEAAIRQHGVCPEHRMRWKPVKRLQGEFMGEQASA